MKSFTTWTPFNIEGYKLVLDENDGCWVEVRFFTRLIDAEVHAGEKRVQGVVIHNIEGYSFIAAKAFIDCTGDAVLANLCGADCWEAGRDTPKIMPATLPSLCSMTGQAAGTAAVQSIRRDQPACSLDTAELVMTLRKHGAKLPQKELSSIMTKGPVS